MTCSIPWSRIASVSLLKAALVDMCRGSWFSARGFGKRARSGRVGKRARSGGVGKRAHSGRVERRTHQAEPGNMQAPFELASLLKKALTDFENDQNSACGTKFVIKRVTAWPDDRCLQEMYLSTMRKQAEQPTEIDGWLARNGMKMLLWSVYVPADGSRGQVKRSDAVDPNVYIDPSLGINREQFVAWYFCANRCKMAACEAKLLLDSVAASGHEILVRAGMTRNLTENCLVQKVHRIACKAELAINAFHLIDMSDEIYFDKRNDATFPMYHQGTASSDSGTIEHEFLMIRCTPVEPPAGGGEAQPVTIYIDPTFRQLMPDVEADFPVPFIVMGPGVDAPYCAGGTSARVFDDREPFIPSNINIVWERMIPAECGYRMSEQELMAPIYTLSKYVADIVMSLK